jgi:hypothetical protein
LQKLPRELWLAELLQKDPEVLEYRERLRCFTKQPSYARYYHASL